MCFGMNCIHEDYFGECTKGYYDLCPLNEDKIEPEWIENGYKQPRG